MNEEAKLISDDSEAEQLLELIAAWRDQRITDDEMRELNERLRGDEDAQRVFARFVSLDNALEGLGPDAMGARLIPFPSQVETPRPSRRRVLWRSLELAALLTVLGLAGWLLLSRSGDGPKIAEESAESPVMPMDLENLADYKVKPVETIEPERAEAGFAILTHTIEAEWAEGGRELRSGAILGRGRVQLASGFVHLQYYNGVSVTLEGPVDFEILSMDESFCWQGKIHATVPVQAFGFIVHTPTGELVDLGTVFGLIVGLDGSSEVHVFDGEVEFRNPREETVANLTPGDAARIGEFGRRIPLLADEDLFVSSRELREIHSFVMESQLSTWYQKSQRWRGDKRLLAYYDFDAQDYLDGLVPAFSSDPYASGLDGRIIGARLAQGRWTGKVGLEFMRSSDRVRVRIPGNHDELTMSTWVRIDRLEARDLSLFMSDEFDHGAVHWVLDGEDGRVVLRTRRNEGEVAEYASPAGIIDKQLLGQWAHLACVYDRIGGTATHYLNGVEIGHQPLELDVRLRFGIGEIGNWGLPPRGERVQVRNFLGVMDEFVLFQKAFDAEEIAELASTGEPG
ncbi:MAG: hypothetical protein ACI8UO_005025 [Verrucomicrobiales bacterium]|jgi:hypothetical protein